MRDMYSQCPKCQAIFSVSESDLGAHQGLVRCGHCQSVFHAAMNEVEDVQIPSGGALPGESGETPPSRDADSRIDPDHTGLFDAADAGRTPEADPGEVESPVPDIGRDAEDPIEGEQPGQAGPGAKSKERQAGERVKPVSSRPDAAGDASTDRGSEWPGEVEEILIEAPRVLWNVFDEEVEDQSKQEGPQTGDAENRATTDAEDAPKAGRETAPRLREARQGASGTRRRTPPKSPYWARDIRMVELPRPRPFKTATLFLMTVLLVLLLVWQVKAFYLDELAQVPVLRPHLEWICRPLGCVLPPRRSFAQVDLVGTSIDVNPEIPGALEIKASLINRAHFPQPYPPLRVTLTDREGRVVGRRTYLPSEYREDKGRELLPIKAARDVSIKLAQPAGNAVGYEVELIAPPRGG